MQYGQTLQAVLAYIDANITEELSMALIAEKAGYSAYHFGRVFTESIGVSPMSYVTWRKLQFALHDLSRGRKVIDVASEYGFETHAGFTKAFVRQYGFPPSLCYTRINAEPPAPVSADILKIQFTGGNTLQPHIMEVTPFAVAGYSNRHQAPHMRTTGDAPTFWNTLNLDYGPLLSKLYDTFPLSKHCEISMCYDVDEASGEFSYMLGRGIDNPADLANIQPDMTRVDITGGLYAIFSTPPVADSYIQTVQDAWNEIFLRWLPQSEFEYDAARHDFEYHDKRDHGEYFGGKLQIDIYVPIKQRQAEAQKARLREGRKG